ncbi:hypothetical protein [Haladaptatus sp. ZSTT2]|uniref:hypothetical protein n=1 Tax=Haladaptatus sp. ZSTT2 TaxID=3120515 RepID=UPI00300EB7A2
MAGEINDNDIDKLQICYDRIANDGLKILRYNLVIIGIYISVIGFLFQSSPELQYRLITSYYTWCGAFVWLLSSFYVLFAYDTSRKLSVVNFYPNMGRLLEKTNPRTLTFNVRAAVYTSAIAFSLLGVGIFDSFLPVGIALEYIGVSAFIILVVAVIPLLVTKYGLFAKRTLEELF